LVETCGGDEKVNLGIFPFFVQNRANWDGVSQIMALSDDISHFSYV
jgi:hypothetical protein